MARPTKQTVDYFPHFVKSGRTVCILENRFGNDGYAFWFKLLEILGETEGHAYDCSNSFNWEFLQARTHTDGDTASKIVNVLIDLGKIDRELWEQDRVIWVDNFVRNLSEVYRNRKTEKPRKPRPKNATSGNSNAENPGGPEVCDTETDKVKESKVKESKEKESKVYPFQGIADLWNGTCVSLPKLAKLNDKRKQKIKCRLEEMSSDPEQWLPLAQALFERIEASDFLTGRTTTRTHEHWTATFDWVFENSTNWVKVTEGNYDNRKPAIPVQLLGPGEFIDSTGRRTYGTGTATIPQDAPPRPSAQYGWDAETRRWII